MIDNTIIPEILICLAILFTAKFVTALVKEHRARFEAEKSEAKERYTQALTYYCCHKEDQRAKEKLFSLGNSYYEFTVPDVYSYPLPDYGYSSEVIDNSEVRKEMIKNDITQFENDHPDLLKQAA